MDNKATPTNAAVSAYMRAEMKARGITQEAISERIGRKSQSYVSNCMTGIASWRIEELDILAPMFGFPDALALIASARPYANRAD